MEVKRNLIETRAVRKFTVEVISCKDSGYVAVLTINKNLLL
jgi:hypothetical protein